MSPPLAVFFDLDETLIENKVPVPDLFGSMYFEFEETIGPDRQEQFFANLRASINGLWDAMFETHQSPEQQLSEAFARAIVATNANLEGSPSDHGEAMLERFCQRSAENVILHPGALDTLAELRDAGFITGIITNGIEQLQLSKIQRLKLDEEVDHVVVSAQARAHKPRKEVFDLALERAAVKPAQAWQIGDHATNDVAGAIRAGMSGVFFDPEGTRRATAFSKLEVEPTHVISSLPQVIRLLS